jgi:hypothetical protein
MQTKDNQRLAKHIEKVVQAELNKWKQLFNENLRNGGVLKEIAIIEIGTEIIENAINTYKE